MRSTTPGWCPVTRRRAAAARSNWPIRPIASRSWGSRRADGAEVLMSLASTAPSSIPRTMPPGASFRAARRLGAIGISEILKIGAIATRLKREGRPVIVLGAGEPDFDTPDHVKLAAEEAIRAGQTKYTVLDGTAELKAAIAGKFRRENGLDYAIDEITAGAGAKQVIHNAFMATLDPGDEVILAAPYWTSYADMVLIADGTPVNVVCSEANG